MKKIPGYKINLETGTIVGPSGKNLEYDNEGKMQFNVEGKKLTACKNKMNEIIKYNREMRKEKK